MCFACLSVRVSMFVCICHCLYTGGPGETGRGGGMVVRNIVIFACISVF